MIRKKIGETFSIELEHAGLIGLPFSWGSDGSITYAPDMDSADVAKVESVYASHDPDKKMET